jgi:uncharacterized protein YigA (DUF484 family)
VNFETFALLIDDQVNASFRKFAVFEGKFQSMRSRIAHLRTVDSLNSENSVNRARARTEENKILVNKLTDKAQENHKLKSLFDELSAQLPNARSRIDDLQRQNAAFEIEVKRGMKK